MPSNTRPTARPVLLFGALALLAGCQIGTPYHDPTGRADDDMQAVLKAYAASGAQPIHTLSVQAARTQPTMLAAYRTVMKGKAGQPFTAAAFTKVTDLTVEGAAGPLPARLYDPAPGHRAQPVILYFHGGVGVTGSAAEDDDIARALAVDAKAMVLSVDYRLAPENKFPAAYDDAVASYRWLLGHVAGLGADRRRIAVAGEAFGGTLALDVAVAARDGNIARPVHVLLIDPMGGTVERTSSAIRNTYAIPLDRADIDWSFRLLAATRDGLSDPRLDLVGPGDVHNLPPVSVVYSEMDPLDSEGKVLAAKLQEAGVDVRQEQYAGTTYGFFGMGAAVARAKEAEEYAATELTGTFSKIGDPPAPASRRPAARPVRHRRR